MIDSVSRPFCGACTRVRLTTDGKIVTCLFAESGLDVRTPLREGATHEELLALIGGVWAVRRDRYSEERGGMGESQSKSRGRMEMYQLGG